MKFKNANPNGWNVVINNLQPMTLFFSKNIENWVIEDFKVCLGVEIP